MYEDGSCKSTCTKHYTITTIGHSSFCNYPCSSGEYLYADGQCLANRDSPMLKRSKQNHQFCDEVIGETETKEEKALAKVISDGRQILDISALITTVLNLTNPGAFFPGDLCKDAFLHQIYGAWILKQTSKMYSGSKIWSNFSLTPFRVSRARLQVELLDITCLRSSKSTTFIRAS